MPSSSWSASFMNSGTTDGAAITAASRTSCLPAATGSPKLALPSGLIAENQMYALRAFGRISCVVTTPGTARFDLSLGGVVVFDTGAINLNIVAKTNVTWWLDVLLAVRARGGGTSALLFGIGTWTSEAVIASPTAATGGNGVVTVPYNTAPVVGGGFDSTQANPIDFSFTQTVATGSMTLHGFSLALQN